jgi:hypothetical protein
MPLKRDEQGGGTNADGTKSTMYCSRCYKAGEFTQPEIKLEEMKTLVKGKLKEFGFPGIVAGLFTRNMHKLQRWRR